LHTDVKNNTSNIDLDQLANKYGVTISRLSHRMIRNNELAKEAAQETWFEIIKSIRQFKGNSEISTWIYTIAKRTILRYAQSERIYKDREITAHFELEPIEYHGQEQEKKEWVKEKCDDCLTAFCHCLDNEARLIFLFKNVAGLSNSQISEVMEIGEENIRQILSRSKAKVRNFLNNNCILYNPDGQCKCRIRKHILAVNLDKEFERLTQAAHVIEFFKKFDLQLPRKNYWEKFISATVTN
jgi:RNA polymerase sigma factor (sigma-70 family)